RAQARLRQRREGALRRQVLGRRRRQEFLGARGAHLARRRRAQAPRLGGRERDREARAEQRRPVEIVVVRVAGAVAQRDIGRDLPLVVAEYRADVARRVRQRERGGVAAFIALQAVRHAE